PAKPIISNLHRKILSRVEKGDTLATFNYDTIIEESMPISSSSWTPREGYGIDVTGVKKGWAKKWFDSHKIEEGTKSEIKLLKLHGSINWRLYKNNKVTLKARPYAVKGKKGKPDFENSAFVPPGWHKRVNRQPYSTIWRKARLEFDRCKTLVIVGYSLPDTDLIARALFLEVARRRASAGKFLKELHVADVSEITQRKIIDVLLPALGPEGKVFRYGDALELATSWSEPKKKS
ncbi:MAG: SIR2 family protein, partial [Pseudolabrys sp.]